MAGLGHDRLGHIIGADHAWDNGDMITRTDLAVFPHIPHKIHTVHSLPFV
ncbi:hypothetical protein SDC9_205461 [bioreactor metagenome]|uniref:Uncharacterized protein n=1 Tax=bioreactor metagenome TaxID=1076179 RepID=A0A645J2Z1_9ZZZZ